MLIQIRNYFKRDWSNFQLNQFNKSENKAIKKQERSFYLREALFTSFQKKGGSQGPPAPPCPRILKFENWTNIIRHGHSARPTEKRGSSREPKQEAIRIGGPFHAFCKLWCSVDILRQALLHAPRTSCLYMCDRAHFRHHTYATIHKRGHPLIMNFQVLFVLYTSETW